MPVRIAKTQYSLSADLYLKGAPTWFNFLDVCQWQYGIRIPFQEWDLNWWGSEDNPHEHLHCPEYKTDYEWLEHHRHVQKSHLPRRNLVESFLEYRLHVFDIHQSSRMIPPHFQEEDRGIFWAGRKSGGNLAEIGSDYHLWWHSNWQSKRLKVERGSSFVILSVSISY